MGYNEALFIKLAQDIIKMAETYPTAIDLYDDQHDFGGEVIDRLISYGIEFGATNV